MLGSILVPLIYGKKHLGLLAIKGLEASLMAQCVRNVLPLAPHELPTGTVTAVNKGGNRKQHGVITISPAALA